MDAIQYTFGWDRHIMSLALNRMSSGIESQEVRDLYGWPLSLLDEIQGLQFTSQVMQLLDLTEEP
jgi:hypothetical protein